MMFLPASDGFAPNINVQIQIYSGTIEDYEKLSMDQFKQFKFNVIKSKQTGESIIFEYAGGMQGIKLH
ncbi:MAG TPA: hypothetical protein P5239_02485 [Victivallales bacterium]|nr:hypothetical protein [Victivallales bacterium]HRU00550.1 hypothetical protein [Victivallales bacterium]